MKQPRLEYYGACLANPLCKEDGCCSHIPTGGRVTRQRMKWSPQGWCAEHMRANAKTPACEWTICNTSSPVCTNLSMQYGKGKCYACSQGDAPSARSLLGHASRSIPAVPSSSCPSSLPYVAVTTSSLSSLLSGPGESFGSTAAPASSGDPRPLLAPATDSASLDRSVDNSTATQQRLVAFRPKEKCNNYPVCRRARKRLQGQPRMEFGCVCLENVVCKEDGCRSHVPTGGKVPGKRITWSPNGRCLEHMRAFISSCEWTSCNNLSAGCKHLSVKLGERLGK